MGQSIVLFWLGRVEALFTLEELCPGSWLSLTAWSLQIRSWPHNGGLGTQGGSSSTQAPLVQSESCTLSTLLAPWALCKEEAHGLGVQTTFYLAARSS